MQIIYMSKPQKTILKLLHEIRYFSKVYRYIKHFKKYDFDNYIKNNDIKNHQYKPLEDVIGKKILHAIGIDKSPRNKLKKY